MGVHRPFGNYVKHSAPVGSQPDFHGPSSNGAWSTFTNPQNLSTGCVSASNLPRDCNRTMLERMGWDFASNLPGFHDDMAMAEQFYAFHVDEAFRGWGWPHSGAEYWGWEDSLGLSLAPGSQSPQKPIDTSLDVNAIGNTVKEWDTGSCKEFVKDLLTEAGKRGGDDPAYTDLVDLFNAVSSQGGFSVGIFKDAKGAQITYSTENGAVGAGNAQLLLSGTSNLYETPELRTYYHTSNAIGELTHVAGHKPSGYVDGAFSDVNLARVAYDVAKAHGKLFKAPPTVDPYKDSGEGGQLPL